MAKEVYAATLIKVAQNEYIEPGEKLDPKQFTKEQLNNFYDVGAIELRDVPDPEPAKGPDTKLKAKEEEPKKDAK